MMPANPKNILIIRLSSIGDILLSTPLLRLLRYHFPEVNIDFVIKKQFADLLRTNINISNLLLFDTNKGKKELAHLRDKIRQNRYDLILDIHKNFRSLFLSLFLAKTKVKRYPKYYLKRFLLVRFGWNLYPQIIPVHQRYLLTVTPWGISDDGQGLDFIIAPSENSYITKRIKDFAHKKRLVGLAPGASFANKRWPMEYYAQVAQKMQSNSDAEVVFLGNKNDRLITNKVAAMLTRDSLNLAGELSIMETAAAIGKLDLLITNDTGLMHLACALRIPTLAIFGPTTRELGFFPLDKQALVIENQELPCRPCTHMGSDKCPKKHFRCMLDILPEAVYAHALHILN